MGELHLDIYVERMKREYLVETIVGQPQVAYRETIATKVLLLSVCFSILCLSGVVFLLSRI